MTDKESTTLLLNFNTGKNPWKFGINLSELINDFLSSNSLDFYTILDMNFI